MTHKISFNQKTSIIAGKDQEYNRLMVTAQCNHINDVFKARGYVYLEYIYGCFGLIWNPLDENICFIRKDGIIDLKATEVDGNGYEITFTY